MDAEPRAQQQAKSSSAGPESFGKQLTLVIIVAVLVLISFQPGGLLIAITGVFAFLDAWSAGIRKDPSKRSFLNLSPREWGIAVIFLFLISYPLYVFARKRLKTAEGNIGYWVATNVFGIITLAFFAIQIIVLLGWTT